MPRLSSLLLLTCLCLTTRQVSAYPGALCNVTYSIPARCGQVMEKITNQMKLWDNTTSCAGNCEQRFFLSDQRGPPLVPVTLEGTGEQCDKCPCGQKCMYVHTETTQNIVRGSHITPVIRYVDDISFKILSEDETYCKLNGYSFSTGPA